MNVRTVLFTASRKYLAMTLVILACYATSFIAAYLLPAAVVCFAACMLFAGAGVLCQRAPKSTDQRSNGKLPRLSVTETGSTTVRLGVTPAERN